MSLARDPAELEHLPPPAILPILASKSTHIIVPRPSPPPIIEEISLNRQL